MNNCGIKATTIERPSESYQSKFSLGKWSAKFIMHFRKVSAINIQKKIKVMFVNLYLNYKDMNRKGW